MSVTEPCFAFLCAPGSRSICPWCLRFFSSLATEDVEA